MQLSLEVDIRGIDPVIVHNKNLVVTITRLLRWRGGLTLLRLDNDKLLLGERIHEHDQLVWCGIGRLLCWLQASICCSCFPHLMHMG